jgi:peptide/nickel transport system substrate-binding protein
MLRNEADNLAAKVTGPSSPERTRRAFNAELAVLDSTGAARPYLAEALPQLNSETWRVSPDGTMETTYRLRANLSWHDGAALTAEDFVFAWRMYTAPSLALFTSTPQDLIEEVAAPDPRTVVIRWRTTYPEAGALAWDLLPPLPRHVLEPMYAALGQPGGRDTLANHAFWTKDYVGAGPYRLARWEAGYELEGAAFDGHALGRPKIDRIILRIMNDENTALSALLAGSFDYAECFVFMFEHVKVLQQGWIPSGKGLLRDCPVATNSSAIQFRPEYQKSVPLLDLRVRRAIAHAIDRQAIHEGIYDGQGNLADTFVPIESPHYAVVDRLLVRYPYDPRRTEQLMAEAGLVRDGEGLFASRSGERFRPEYWVTAGAQSERISTIMAETWRRAGIDSQPLVLSLAATRDNEVRATLSGMAQGGITSQDDAIENFVTTQIGTAANRWRGSNRGGWENAEIDRLWAAYNSTLDRGERTRQFAEIVRIISDQLPVLTYNPNLRWRAHITTLRGPGPNPPATLAQWNIYEWEFR